MIRYQIEFKKSVVKDLRKIPHKTQNNILSAITKLAKNPYLGDIKKMVNKDDCLRLRVGDYRVIFVIDKTNHTIIIYYIRHRKDVYR